MKVLQFRHAQGVRLGVVDDDGAVTDVADALARRGTATTFTGALVAADAAGGSMAALLSALVDEAVEPPGTLSLRDAAVDFADQRMPLAPPVDAPEVWASGVTYKRSRTARIEESGEGGRDFYDRVYDAERPELFLKDAGGRRTVAAGEFIGVRGDSTWTVPEPELALVLDRHGTILAYTVGNDVTARDVEAQNPLYLPQAKVFTGACALGPVALLAGDDGVDTGVEPVFSITVRILESDGTVLYDESISTASMKRSLSELTDHLCRYNDVPDGTVLLTGTGLVPPDDVALGDTHRVEVGIDGIGTLWNPVRVLP